jgi:DNA-binding transcriptional ArsR family regulator
MNEKYKEMERLFLALGDKTRIRLVGLMRDGEVSVNYLCESLGESQPKVSRHLAYLRSMGMVNTRRDGKWIYYSLAEPESRFGARLLQDALGWIGSLDRALEARENPRMRNMERVETTIPPTSEPIEPDIYDYTDMNDPSGELEVYLL